MSTTCRNCAHIVCLCHRKESEFKAGRKRISHNPIEFDHLPTNIPSSKHRAEMGVLDSVSPPLTHGDLLGQTILTKNIK